MSLRSADRVQVLKRSLIFSRLTEGELVELASLAVERIFTSKQVVAGCVLSPVDSTLSNQTFSRSYSLFQL